RRADVGAPAYSGRVVQVLRNLPHHLVDGRPNRPLRRRIGHGGTLEQSDRSKRGCPGPEVLRGEFGAEVRAEVLVDLRRIHRSALAAGLLHLPLSARLLRPMPAIRASAPSIRCRVRPFPWKSNTARPARVKLT